MKRLLLATSPIFLAAAACGGASIPAAGPARESGQSSLMSQTVAGQGKCDPKAHDRPFIIEWDATDMSSFEAKAASDVVFVKYEGCNLKVLDGCQNDSIRGALGAYGAVEWTSGSVEKVDIANEGELYAKLPLGVNSLGGRVHGGEQFHMEYYVSGTRKATRDEMYRKDLDAIPRCAGATHFVYAYNLGAFALGSAKQVKAEAGGTVWGIGVGGGTKSVSNAEKKGGVLTSCAGETAKEAATCKVPIRLTLREISEGENPDATAARAPETPDALNLAGKLDAKLKMGEQAQARYRAAVERAQARDGKACLKELNAFDKLDPKNASTSPRSPMAYLRATCVMLSGMCDAGKKQFRRALEVTMDVPPEQLDSGVDNLAMKYCQGASMSPREQLLKASQDLSAGSTTKKDVAFCRTNYDTVKRLAQTVKPKDDDDAAVKYATAPHIWSPAASGCFARAGDCDAAFKAFLEGQAAMVEGNPTLQQPESALRQTFVRQQLACKAWNDSRPLTPRDQLVKAMQDLTEGGRTKTDVATCKKNLDTINRLSGSVQVEATDYEATSAKNPYSISRAAMMCFAKAGDCDAAAKAFDASNPAFSRLPENVRRQSFEAQNPSCKK